MDEIIKIKTGDYEVLASGQFIAISNAISSIELKKDSDQVTFEFEFQEDETKKPVIKSEDINPTTLKIKFLNFDSTLGIGNTKPLEVGTFGGKKLFFSYRIFNLSDRTLRTLEYTFYLHQNA